MNQHEHASREPFTSFVARAPFDPDTLADQLFIGCSDFRFRVQFEEFLARVAGERADRLIVPGGVLFCYAGELGYPGSSYPTNFWSKFLVEHHHIRTVVAVGHEGCAAYGSAPSLAGMPREAVIERQIADLKRFKREAASKLPGAEVLLYMARIDRSHDRIVFYPVE